VVMVLGALAGIGVSAAHVLPWAMIPDTIEWDEARTGRRHEGMFYSLIMLAQKAAAGVAIFLLGVALEAAGYVANAPTQTPAALTAIRVMTGPVPALLLCGGIVLGLLYPLSRSRYQALAEEIARSPGALEGPPSGT